MWVLAATSAIYFNKELFHSQLSGEKCCNFIFKSWLWNLWGKKERDQFQFPSNFHPIKYHDIWKIRCSIASMGIHSIPSSFLGQRDTFSRFNFTFELSSGLKKGHLQDIVIDEFWWFSSMCHTYRYLKFVRLDRPLGSMQPMLLWWRSSSSKLLNWAKDPSLIAVSWLNEKSLQRSNFVGQKKKLVFI